MKKKLGSCLIEAVFHSLNVTGTPRLTFVKQMPYNCGAPLSRNAKVSELKRCYMMLSKKNCTCIMQYGVYEFLLSETTAKVTICNFILHVFFSLLHQFHSFNLFIRFSYLNKFLIKKIFLRGFLNIYSSSILLLRYI